MGRPKRDVTFTETFALYNVNHSSPHAGTEDILDRMRRKGVSCVLMQEVKKPHRKAIRDAGYAHRYQRPEFAVAWDKSVWKPVGKAKGIVLSGIDYWLTENLSLVVPLVHRETGVKVLPWTIHTPAHVTVKHHHTQRAAFANASQGIKRVQKRSKKWDATIIAGGDFNVRSTLDEYPGRDKWGRIFEGPLRIHGPGEGTHGKRDIDFWLLDKNVQPIGDATVWNTPGDHDSVIQSFRITAPAPVRFKEAKS